MRPLPKGEVEFDDMQCTLQIRLSDSSQRKPVAWWLAGGEAADWITEICQWPIDQDRVRIVAVHDANHASAGALVIVPEHDAEAVEKIWPNGVGFGCLGERLYLPVFAALDPPAELAELESLLPDGEELYIWHPSRGLLRCDPFMIFRIEDLVAIPPLATQPWNAAVSAVRLNQQLRSVTPAAPVDADDIIESAGDDIGSEAEHVHQLPLSPNEQRTMRFMLGAALILLAIIVVSVTAAFLLRGSADVVWQVLVLYVAAAVVLLCAYLAWRHLSAKAKNAPAEAKTWTQKATRWISNRVNAIDKKLNVLRNREVERLLNMLHSDPDEGLRYAIPLTHEPSHRGVGHGSASLFKRIVDFSLSRLGGSGGPASYWHIEVEHQQQLIQRYRELANREITLRRFRRAAYIYAELLYDFRMAASTLADGGFYREAAAVYEQKLFDLTAAARCFEHGGLLAEAIAIYERQGHHLKVAELYARLEQLEPAIQAYERAANQRLEQCDYLGAAELIESKLKLPERALTVLLSGWPHSEQSGRCLDESFRLLGRQHAHDRAIRQLEQLCNDYGATEYGRKLIRSLLELTKRYPAAHVRQLAEDKTLVLTSHFMDQASAATRNQLLRDITHLIPHDRLFARDCARHESPPPRRAPARVSSVHPIHIANQFRLTVGDESWRTVVEIGDEFYAAGYRDQEVLLVRGSWDGTLQQPAGRPWKVSAECVGQPILVTGTESSKVLVHTLYSSGFDVDREFPNSDWFHERLAGGHPAIDHFVVGMQATSGGNLVTLRLAAEGWVLAIHRLSSGELLHTRNFGAWLFASTPNLPVAIGHFDQTMVAHTANRFVSLDGQKSHAVPMASPIRSLVSQGSHHLALLEYGAYAWFNNPLHYGGVSFVEEMESPVGCFLSPEMIFVADANSIQLYRRRSSGLELVSVRQGLHGKPIACIAIPGGKAGLFMADGRVFVLNTNS